MVDLFRDLQYQRDRAAQMAEAIGLPFVRSLIICRRQTGQATDYTTIEPKPDIRPVSPRLQQAFEGINSIQLELEDMEISGISKEYSASELVGRGIYYLIDGEMVAGSPVGGFEADKVPGMSLMEQGNTWSLVVRRRKP